MNAFDFISLACLIGLAIDVYPAAVPLAAVGRIVNAGHVWYMFYDWPLFPALVTGLLFALHHSRCLGRLIDNRVFLWTAQISYGIYLWHMVVLELLMRCWPAFFGQSRTSHIAYVCGALAITYSLAAASFYCVEQPVMQWLKRRGEAKRASSTPTADRRASEPGFA